MASLQGLDQVGMKGPKSLSPVLSQSKFFAERKGPVVKKAMLGNKFKVSRMRGRLQLERQRGSKLSTSASLRSSSSFKARFEKHPITFKTIKSPPKTILSPVSLASQSSRSSISSKKLKTTIGTSPKQRGVKKPGIQVSPPSEPVVIPPSATSAEKTVTKFPLRNTKIQQPEGKDDSKSIQLQHDDDDNDIASHLSLVPMTIGKMATDSGDQARKPHANDTKHLFCYWPCLVFADSKTAMIAQRRLYPHQSKIQSRLQKEVVESNRTFDSGEKYGGRPVILPLGNACECCPSEVYKRPIFDGVDMRESSASNEDQTYWMTRETPKGPIKAGQNIIRLLENHEVVNDYLKKSKSQIPLLGKSGKVLESALIELERLCYIDDDDDDDDDDDREAATNRKNSTEKEKSPFVPSLKRAVDDESTLDEDSPLRPIKFPRRVSEEIKVKRSTKTRNALSKAITFPHSTEPSSDPRNPTESKESPTKATKRRARPKATKTVAKNQENVGQPKKTTVIDSKDKISVPSWGTVKPLLERLGHIFYDDESNVENCRSYYCLPHCDPRKSRNAIEGETFFSTQLEYRAHLCANGVEYSADFSKPPINEDELELIAYWVRFHIFSNQSTGGRRNEIVSDLEIAGNPKVYIAVLQRIGYKYISRAIHEGYIIPGELEKGCFRETELWEHLGKFGLSTSCEFGEFESREEQIALEIKIIRKYHGEYGDQVFRKSKNTASLVSPTFNRDALEECTRAPSSSASQERQKALLPRKLTLEANVRTPDSTKLRRTDDGTSSSAVANFDDSSIQMKSKTHEDRNNSTKPVVASRTEESEQDIIEEPIIEGDTVSEKIECCVERLRENKIVASGKLKQSIDRIQSFVDAVVESKGRVGDSTQGSSSPILYICGSPGTGKTMSTLKICRDAVDAINENNKSDTEQSPRVCYLSCPVLKNSKHKDGLRNVLDRMETNRTQMKRSANEKKNAAMILILDEVDQLIGRKGSESVLNDLTKWAKDEKTLLSIIGISNAVFNAKTNRLRNYGIGEAPNKLVFETYRKEDLVRISQSKIGFTVVAKKAHEFIAAKVANSSGDARQYIDLLAKAISFSNKKLSTKQKESKWTKPIVMIRDAMFAIQESNPKMKDIIQSLTFAEQVTLCCGVYLARKCKGRQVYLHELHYIVQDSVSHALDMELEDFKGVIERLCDSGLLRLVRSDNRNHFSISRFSGLANEPVHFDLQLEDVVSAIRDTLENEPFFENIVKRMKSVHLSMFLD